MDDLYRMTVDLNVLDHLGINLYSNIAAVLTEAVANAWDADAEKVDIHIDPNGQWIEIVDDGVGLSIDDMNAKYLRVGYRRRDEDPEHGRITAKRRPVMGRKGLGKLSLFSIANVIEVQSAKGGVSHGLRMTVDGIEASVKRKELYYSPDPLAEDSVIVEKGTRIVLRDIKRQRLGKGVTALRKRLARRFSVIGEAHSFKITIDGRPISTADRGDLPMVQFLWRLEDSDIDLSSAAELLEQEELPNRLAGWEAQEWKVTGWIGTARLPKQLDSEDAGNLNGIVVFARGRLFHENVLDKLNDGRLYTKYLTGQIEADFLDADDEPDIATSDRQRVQEDDPRYTQLIVFLRSRLVQVEKRWNEWRRKHEVEKAKENSPKLAEWLDGLQPGFRQSAETLISKLSALPIDDEEDRKVLYRHGILAFERMQLRGSSDELARHVDNVEKLLTLLADRDALEASLYRDIVKSRLEAIKEFQSLIDEDAKERVLQKYLFDHLWLLDPAWDRATGSPIMESRLIAEGILTDDMTKKEELGRVDIAYRTNAGKHIIVELKKVGRKMRLLELQDQGQTYVDKLRKILVQMGESDPDIEVVFVLGKTVDEETSNPERLKSSMAAISPGSRIKHYDALILGAQVAYSAYIEKTKVLDKLEDIVNGI
ncbi:MULTISPECIES: ATP-binding protein [unclassified Pseudomonas]|uniref:BbrUII/HgiDII family restriction enzyme n=1 Tax=unclassified Pseudomonas TaxID=196821 RepID=UPI000C881C2D|nr:MULTISPECIES: ATP-binding protein [unclassified Pseudomonas]PMZ72463.1 ATP-binding protein [Pseudomonas sp. GW247-3R2A]PMY73090.1 ATP-binding protein [Pseudomonas sp. MPR-R3A]PMY97947.1 ATP-binding protein [Pseudomonas sp. FW305-124]PNA91772.1 ATP-binding protein [Pseudomonas sp. FW300-E2]PNB02864.1 ATP-binding protein [Pseudomonas sp. MPR-AND1B]